MLFKREKYLKKIRPFYHDDDIIKVITGVRRCGKSSLMETIADEIKQSGVDEDNIREMFGILRYLDIDFIINSQVLWGYYDTIDDLSICELIRPQNSQIVTVERYRWNGLYKEIIDNRHKYNEELEDARV